MSKQAETITRVVAMYNRWQKKAWRHLKMPYTLEEKEVIRQYAVQVTELKWNFLAAAKEVKKMFPWRSTVIVRIKIRKQVDEWLK
jgi:hypothetical protein